MMASELNWGVALQVPSKVKGKKRTTLSVDKKGRARIFATKAEATGFAEMVLARYEPAVVRVKCSYSIIKK